MAIVAAVNLGLVVFDLTYVSWRNFWLQSNIPIPLTDRKIHLPFPQMECRDRSVRRGQEPETTQKSVVTCLYDPIKGIESHRETHDYLRTVDQLQAQMAQKGLGAGLQSPEVQQTLAKLRQQSEAMLAQNPFEAAGKSGTLERIRREMREHVGERIAAELSTTESFLVFWSTNHPTYPNFLNANNFNEELAWFNINIRPLIETNFFRSIDVNGSPTNHFWILDAPFVILFLLEFLARTFYISRRYTSLNWLDAMIWRWYDVPLFIPFSLFMPVLALTRAVPTIFRLHQSKIINLHDVNVRIREGFVGSIAEEITEVVVVQVVNQVQRSIERGTLTGMLSRLTTNRYVDINNINEIEEISKRMIELVVYQVFPKVQPDLENLIQHSVTSVLGQSPVYQGLTALPGIGNVPGQITERLVADITQTTYDTLKVILENPKTTDLVIQLVRNFSTTVLTEAQEQQRLAEIQGLLSDFLEEIKISYIQGLTEEDLTFVLDETRQLKQQAMN